MQTDYYRIESQEHVPPLLFEVMLGQVEGDAVKAIDAIIEAESPYDVDPGLVVSLAVFVAFQWVRGEMFRRGQEASLTAMYRMAYGELTDDAIRAQLVRAGEVADAEAMVTGRQFIDDLREGRIVLSPHKSNSIAMSGEMAVQIGEWLITRRWHVYRGSGLATSDEPVVTVGGPGLSRREESGIGLAGAVLFPLSPSALLVMFHPLLNLDPGALVPDLVPAEVAECNLEIAANSTRWVFEQPPSHAARTICVPVRWPEAATEQLVATNPDDPSELHRFFRRTRWVTTPSPPKWPVDRWWREGWSVPMSEVHRWTVEMGERNNPHADE